MGKEELTIEKKNLRVNRWENKLWKQVIDIRNGKNQKDVENPNGEYPIYGSGGVFGYADEYLCPENTTIIGRKGSINNPIYVETKFWNVDTAFGLVPKKELEPKFFYYFCLGFDFIPLNKSTTIPSLTKKNLSEISIPVPPLPEQHRIVSKLDALFAEIDTSLALIDLNIAQAEALKLSVLDEEFGNKSNIISWESKKLGKCFKLKSGENLTRKKMIENGEYPVYGGNGITGYYNDYNLSGSNIVIGRVGALCGNVRELNENIWLTDNAFQIVDLKYDFNYSFLVYLLNYKDLRSYARQAAQPVISNIGLKDIILNFPKDITTQYKIARKLDALFAEIDALVLDYTKKRDNLEALKSSLLDQAFKGEL